MGCVIVFVYRVPINRVMQTGRLQQPLKNCMCAALIIKLSDTGRVKKCEMRCPPPGSAQGSTSYHWTFCLDINLPTLHQLAIKVTLHPSPISGNVQPKCYCYSWQLCMFPNKAVHCTSHKKTEKKSLKYSVLCPLSSGSPEPTRPALLVTPVNT